MTLEIFALILGDGAWGTTLAILLSNNRHDVLVWSVFGDHLDELDKKRENEKYLKGIKIPDNIIFEKDLKKAIEFGDFIIFSKCNERIRAKNIKKNDGDFERRAWKC